MTQPRRTCRSCGNEFLDQWSPVLSACFAMLSPARLNPASPPLAIHSRQHRKTQRTDLSIMSWCGATMGHRSSIPNVSVVHSEQRFRSADCRSVFFNPTYQCAQFV